MDQTLPDDRHEAANGLAQPQPAAILVIGAHPDDADEGAGGLAALCVRAGHRLHFVSLTNGDAGHHRLGGAPLARLRLEEAKRAAAVLGIEYTVLDIHDGEIEPSLANRRLVIDLIRKDRPDLVVTHRPHDYHPDHRYTAALVQDAAYLVTVPGIVGLTPALSHNPVIAYMSDPFRRPYPFEPDVVVDIDEVLALKMEMLHQHMSQMYEWLPYTHGDLSNVPADEEGRRAWLSATWAPAFAAIAERYRSQLIDLYGVERGKAIQHAEAFETCEYGASLTTALRRRLFPFVPG
jgi:LmbE family N-acetylglucosaminyl deacetylase